MPSCVVMSSSVVVIVNPKWWRISPLYHPLSRRKKNYNAASACHLTKKSPRHENASAAGMAYLNAGWRILKRAAERMTFEKGEKKNIAIFRYSISIKSTHAAGMPTCIHAAAIQTNQRRLRILFAEEENATRREKENGGGGRAMVVIASISRYSTLYARRRINPLSCVSPHRLPLQRRRAVVAEKH